MPGGVAAVIPVSVVVVNLVTNAADLRAGRPGVGLLTDSLVPGGCSVNGMT